MATTLDLVDDAIRRNENYEMKDEIFSHTFAREMCDISQPSEQSAFLSSVTLGNTFSHLSGDVDRWIHGSGRVLPHNRVPVTQRSTLVNPASLGCISNSVWYMIATILPIFNFQNCTHWRTRPSNILAAVELFHRQLTGFCTLVRNLFRTFTDDQLTQDIFTAVMNFVLVIYSIGFLVLSMYQASMIG